MRVGLFGYYSYNNFGDDLMAYMFYSRLKSLDYEVCIYSKSKVFNCKNGFEVFDSILNFINNVEVVVIGGGGLLIPERNIFSKISRFNEELNELVDHCIERKIPFFPISVGGSGENLERIIPPVRAKIITESQGITVRNLNDLSALKQANKPCHFFHDIVWLTPYFFPKNTSKNSRKKVGISININRFLIFKIRYLNAIFIRIFIFLLKTVFKLKGNYEYVFFDISSSPKKFKTFKSDAKPKNFYNRKFSNMEDDINFIQSLDLLITDRLHISVAALSYNIPVINISCEPKVVLFFKNCSLEKLNLKHFYSFKLIYQLLSKAGMCKLFNILEGFDSTPFVESAENHFVEMERMLKSLDNVK